MKFLFDLSAIYLSYLLGCAVLCSVANRVDTMNDLLSFSGWHILANSDHRVDIIDPPWTECRLSLEHFLVSRVNHKNVADKIRLAHQFLNCSYASVLLDLCDYDISIGPQCRNMDTASKSFDCLEDYLGTIRLKHPLVARMTGALSSLNDLALPNTLLHKDVFNVLLDMHDYYQEKTVARPAVDDDLTIWQIAFDESSAIEQHASDMSDQLNAFYNSFCRPMFAKRNVGAYGVDRIKRELRVIIKQFAELHDTASGFEYDPESNITRIITFDMYTTVRMDRLNQFLDSNIFKWNSLKPLEIKERGSPYRTDIDDFLKTTDGPDGCKRVTKENVYAKLKQAHQFLSCKYASILKECCDHVEAMWTNCRQDKEFVCLEKFLDILSETDPWVLRMIDALSFFYILSSNTVYNKSVFDLLTRFKSFYVDKTARADQNVRSWFWEVEKTTTEIAQSSYEFYQQFCYSDYPFDTYYVSKDEKYSTIDDKGKVFKRNIDIVTYGYAVFDYTNCSRLRVLSTRQVIQLP